jgi:hypothetical protein
MVRKDGDIMVTTLLALVPLAAQAAGQPASLSADPVVQVGLYSYRGDGTVSGSAYDTAPAPSSTVYASESLCQLGAGYRDLPAAAAYAWKFSGKVLSSSSTEAVLQLEWQRVLDQGNAVSGSATSVQLTVRAGDKVLLDSVLPATARSACASNVGFEVRYASRMPPGEWRTATRVTGSGAGTGSGVGVGGGTGGRVSGGGGGSGVGAGGVGTGTQTSGGGASAVSGGASGFPAGRPLLPAWAVGFVTVELWLVHTLPGQADQVLHKNLRAMPEEGATFSFDPVTIQGAQGPALVQVTGSFAVSHASGGAQLVFTTNRRVSLAQSSTPVRDAPADLQGGSRTTLAMPGPDEVLSFEMPPLKLPGGTAVPDRFSVRVRVGPR